MTSHSTSPTESKDVNDKYFTLKQKIKNKNFYFKWMIFLLILNIIEIEGWDFQASSFFSLNEISSLMFFWKPIRFQFSEIGMRTGIEPFLRRLHFTFFLPEQNNGTKTLRSFRVSFTFISNADIPPGKGRKMPELA